MAAVPYFMVRIEELAALNFLAPDHPRPVQVEWFNRSTNQVLKRQSVDMLNRTLFKDVLSKSTVKLHRSAVLRLEFDSETQRLRFARLMSEAKERARMAAESSLTMIFQEQSAAARAAESLIEAGLPHSAVSIMWRAGLFMDTDHEWVEGHSLRSIAKTTAGGGLTGATLGLALFTIPGIGQVAAIGGLASAAVSATPMIASIIGATAAAIAKMVTDPDVDDVTLNHHVKNARNAQVFITVNLAIARGMEALSSSIMKAHGGRSVTRS